MRIAGSTYASNSSGFITHDGREMMQSSSNKDAVLFLTHVLNDEVMDRFTQLISTGMAAWLLLDSCSCIELDLPPRLAADQVSFFSAVDLAAKGYSLLLPPAIVPGSNHFPVLEFAFQHSEFDRYWAIEYDVMFTGNWEFFFQAFDDESDLLSASTCWHVEGDSWYWWNTFRAPAGVDGSRMRRMRTFNPLYRLSRRAALFLREKSLEGWSGHHEVFMATMLSHFGFDVSDIGGCGALTPEHRIGRFYCEETFHWAPVFESLPPEAPLNMLYHPVKCSP